MRALICAGIAAAGVAYASSGSAEPRVDPHAKYVQAARLANSGDAEQALTLIEEGLAITPRDLPLLGLKGQVLLSLYEYVEASATYQAYLDAGARGANRREAQKILDNLRVVQSTFLDVTVANGPATVYLDSTTHRPLCTAAPTCNKPVLPVQYRVIVERSGFERWAGQVTVVSGETAKLAVSLVEKPSLLTVRVAQPGARILVDGAVHDTPTTVPAGAHRVTVSLAGHVTTQLEAMAHEGKPIDLEVALAPLVPVQLSPPGARLALDGKPIQLEDGGVAVPPGVHVLVASAQGFHDHRVEIPAVRGDGYQLTVALARDVPAAPTTLLGRLSTRRKVAIAAGGVGLAAIATGAVLGLQSRSLNRDTYARCPSPSEQCAAAPEANALNVRARARALEANVAFGVAGGAAIAAAVLWLTGAPESPVAITPRLGARTGEVTGLDLAVRF
ncbi:MAG TPA: PEGA domain-containing protein [Kofleriaceae bacterium]|jgi:hypothetical protein|nr:PEGA domain-containing protein [Kofleriaceae bacterium]